MRDAPSERDLEAMVAGYLDELDRALVRLPLFERDQLVGEIRDHIAERRAERPVRDASDMEALLNRVGLPEDIAAVALEGLDPAQQVDDTVDASPAPRRPRALDGPALPLPGLRRISGPQRTGLVGVAIGVALVLVVGIASVTAHRSGVHGAPNPPSPTTGSSPKSPSLPTRITVPNVIGQSLAQATVSLQSADFSVTGVTQSSSSTAPGLVVSQSPAAGSVAAQQSSVTVDVSTGPPGPA
jgi:hypothetical protein